MNRRLLLSLLLAGGLGRLAGADPKPAAGTAPVVPSTVAAPAGARANSASRPTSAAPRNDSAVVPPSSLTFDSFRIITDRNIFNPNRTGRRDRSEEAAPPRLDVIALVGTMDSDKGLRAFFDGSDSAYRKAVRVGDAIEKFKVAQISANTVALDRDGKTVTLHVGEQLRRPEGADWNLIAADTVRAEAAAKAETKVDPNAPPVIPPNAPEALRRLMEARAKQLQLKQ